MKARARGPGLSGRTAMVGAVLVMATLSFGSVLRQDRARITVKSPVVTIVGCATTTAEPHIWALTHAGEPTPSSTAGITSVEKQDLQKRSLGRGTYQLIGVADFVDADTARRIGARDEIFSPARMNTTGMLASGHKVAVKGLYIAGNPARINLTSVLDLGGACP